MSNGEKQLLSSEETEYIEIAPGKLIAKKQYYYVSEVGNKVTFPESDINTSQFEKVFILPGQEEPLVKLEKAALEAQKEYESVIYVDSSNHP